MNTHLPPSTSLNQSDSSSPSATHRDLPPSCQKAPQSSNPIKVQQCPTTLPSLLHPQPLPSLLQRILQHQPWGCLPIGELYILTYKDVANLTYLVAPHDNAEERKKVSCRCILHSAELMRTFQLVFPSRFKLKLVSDITVVFCLIPLISFP